MHRFFMSITVFFPNAKIHMSVELLVGVPSRRKKFFCRKDVKEAAWIGGKAGSKSISHLLVGLAFFTNFFSVKNLQQAGLLFRRH